MSKEVQCVYIPPRKPWLRCQNTSYRPHGLCAQCATRVRRTKKTATTIDGRELSAKDLLMPKEVEAR